VRLELTGRARGRRLRVLCLGAHPDDIEIGCGGTVARLARRRPRPVFRWVVWSGSPERAREARRGARRFLGPAAREAVTCHDFRDGYFPSQREAIKDRFEALAGFRPDIVFAHAREDRHQDHRVLSDLAWNTFRRGSLILEYEVPKWDGDLGQPNCYVPLSAAEARRKARALVAVFGSQREKSWFTAETFLGLMRLRGVECRSAGGYAEGFYGRKLTLSL
jgi:LmbE family N-acetylglucosaminyl deacetylase